MAVQKKVLTGAALAIAAAGLMFTGNSIAGTDSKEAKIHCTGINSCKGQTACKSASNDCKGKNSCKGHGWLPTANEKECKDKGGKVI